MRNRDITLDVLKGIGMFLVVFAHTNKSVVSSVIYAFHMPLFFLMSGCALNYSSHRRCVGITGYFKSLVMPYLVFSLITFAYWAGIEWKFRPSEMVPIYSGEMGLQDIRLQEFFNIFTAYSAENAFEYNIVMWFLPCLFCCMVIYRWLKLHMGRWLPLCVLGVSAIYFINEKTMPLLPWCLEIALVALPFVLIGDKCYTLVRDKNHWSIITIVLLIIIGGLLFANHHVDMRVHCFSEWWFFFPVALSFIYLTIKLSGIISHYEHGVLQWVGRNSLIIMCVHEPVKRIVLKIVSVISGIDISVLRESVVASILLSITIICLLFPVACFFNRYMPFILGKKTNRIY